MSTMNRIACRNGHFRNEDNIVFDEHGWARCLDCREINRIASLADRAAYMRRYRSEARKTIDQSTKKGSHA